MFIYVLKHPETLKIRYVGKTANLQTRLNQHIADAKRGKKAYLFNWIRQLLRKDLKPVIELVEICTKENVDEREKFHITEFRKTSNLCNLTDGGDGGNFWKDKKFSKQHRERISQALKGHPVSEKTKQVSKRNLEKLREAGKSYKFPKGIKPKNVFKKGDIPHNKIILNDKKLITFFEETKNITETARRLDSTYIVVKRRLIELGLK